MDHRAPKTWFPCDRASNILDLVLRQERDHEAGRRITLTEDVRRQGAALHAEFHAGLQTLAELFPSWFTQRDPSSQQQGTAQDHPSARDSSECDHQVALESLFSANVVQAADFRRPTEPRQRFMKLDSSWLGLTEALAQQDCEGLLAAHGGQAVRGGGITTSELLAQCGTTFPDAYPRTGPDIGVEPIRELRPGQTRSSDEFDGIWGVAWQGVESSEASTRGPGESPPVDRITPGAIYRGTMRGRTVRETAVEQSMSQRFAHDHTLNAWPLDEALPGVSVPLDSIDFRSPLAVGGQHQVEQRGADIHLGLMNETSLSSMLQQAMTAVVEELDRLRTAARRTANELEKLRGPVSPAFPSKPPEFHGRI